MSICYYLFDMRRISPRALVIIATCAMILPMGAQASESGLSDIQQGSALDQAVTYLKTKGILSGYADGTFKPKKGVNRAEAIKILIAPFAANATVTSSPYSDVKTGTWYLPFVETARTQGVIDGPPKKAVFNPDKPITRMEFMKMMLLTYKEDPNAYGEIKLPLAPDVTDPSAWYYPYLRYSLSASVMMIDQQDGMLHPGAELTREDAALYLYRYLMYKADRRTQALLSESESEIVVVLGSLDSSSYDQAEYASARALIAARGVYASRPDLPIVKGALKITEAFRTLVRGYKAGMSKDLDTAIELAKQAWSLADQAQAANPDIKELADHVKEISKNMADSARNTKSQL